MKVLIVDDHGEFRRVARAMLEEQGVEVLDAEDEVAGVRLAQGHRPDALLVDFGVATESHILERVAALPGRPRVILISAWDEADLGAAPRGDLVAGFLPKAAISREAIEKLALSRAGRRLRVALADDTVLLREGMARLLTEADVEVVGQAGDAPGVLRLVATERPDVAVVDMRMPPGYSDEGLHAAREIRARYPETGVLVFSSFLDETFLDELAREAPGGMGYLLKDRVGDLEELLGALRRIADGGSVVDRGVVAQLMTRTGSDDPLGRLTAREREVLSLMAEGRANAAICRDLYISPKTLERHIGSIFSKLGLDIGEDVNRRVAAVIAWLRRG